MPRVSPLPSELRRRKLRGTLRKHVEMKFGKVTDDLFCLLYTSDAADEL